MTQTRAITEHNRDAWNGVAEARRASCQPPEFFAAGGSTLEPEETAAMGSVDGARLLNLQCSSGNEALSWAVKGAVVTGADISDVAIRIAREQAAAAGLEATFVAADIYDLPAELQDESFDVVYSSAGIVCWMPDLTEWARIVARALRPGGRFVLDEHHPAWEIISLTDNGLRISGNYFGRGRANKPKPFDSERSVHAGAAPIRMEGTTFTWPVGDVVTALASAGMRINQLQERPSVDMYAPGDHSAQERQLARQLPAVYLLVAVKERAGVA